MRKMADGRIDRLFKCYLNSVQIITNLRDGVTSCRGVNALSISFESINRRIDRAAASEEEKRDAV